MPACRRFSAAEDKVVSCLWFSPTRHRAKPCVPRNRQEEYFPELERSWPLQTERLAVGKSSRIESMFFHSKK